MKSYTLDADDSKSEHLLRSMNSDKKEISTRCAGEQEHAWHKMLSSDLNTITAQERSEALDDVHCVGEYIQETTEMMDELLAEFDRIVQQEQRPIYAKTARVNKLYVEDPSFRMRFLRCNRYNAKQSVRQMMAFLEHKAAYFEEDKVAREISLNDLTKEEIDLLLSGVYHIQKDVDQAGRLVVHVMARMLGRWKIEALIRAAHYMWNTVILPHPIAQLRGVVAVVYDSSVTSSQKLPMPNPDLITSILMNAVVSFPLRYSAMHFCLKPGTQYLASLNSAAFNQAMNILPRYTRVRTRVHVGTDTALHQSLRSHGLSSESLPIDPDGNVRKEILNEWFHNHQQDTVQRIITGVSADDSLSHAKRSKMQTLLENESDSPSDFSNVFNDETEDLKIVPTRSTTERGTYTKILDNASADDILLGRGWRVQNHEGNVRFRTFLEAHCDAYDSSPRLQKRQMVGDLVRSIQGKGMRFLKQAPSGEWVDSTHDDAENKVSQLFRTIRKNRQAQQTGRAQRNT